MSCNDHLTELCEIRFIVAYETRLEVLLCVYYQSTSSVTDADSQYYWLSTLRLLCIHANCLQQCEPDEISFVQYSLKHLMVPRSAKRFN